MAVLLRFAFLLLHVLLLPEGSIAFSVRRTRTSTSRTTTTTQFRSHFWRQRHWHLLLSSPGDGSTEDAVDDAVAPTISSSSSPSSPSSTAADETETRRRRIQKRVSALARNIVVKPISKSYAMSQNIAEVLKEATITAVDVAVDEVMRRRQSGGGVNGSSSSSLSPSSGGDGYGDNVDITAIVEEAFAPMEQSLDDLEQSLKEARQSFSLAKSQAQDAMEVIQAAATAQAEAAVTAVARAEEVAERKALVDFYNTNTQQKDADKLTLEDIDFATSEMAPPFLGEDQCLVPGEPVVRVEKAPENSRRIFAGIDVMAPADTVWEVLTDYDNLARVVPNLLVNDVLQRYDGSPMNQVQVDTSQPETLQCQEIANQMKGAELRQVGGAKVVGINFSARTTLEVREWPEGLPDFAHFYDEMWEGKSRKERAKDYTSVKLERYRFPRPFAMSKLPTRDITMQSIAEDDGEFRMYQGVWRMQPLPGCAPPGQNAMRLTYAVEVSPRAYLPVQLIEGRIVQDLCTNLNAIRDYVEELVAE